MILKRSFNAINFSEIAIIFYQVCLGTSFCIIVRSVLDSLKLVEFVDFAHGIWAKVVRLYFTTNFHGKYWQIDQDSNLILRN